MQLKLNKTVVLVATTRALQEAIILQPSAQETLQRMFDILSFNKSVHIHSVLLDEYEYELIEPFLEEV